MRQSVGRQADRVYVASLAAPFFETEFCQIPPRLAPWLSYGFLNRPTSAAKSYVFSRLPEATVHVGFFFGLQGSSQSRHVLIAGPQRRLWRVPFTADEVVAVGLRPAGASDLLGVPLHALTDQIIDAQELWGDSALIWCMNFANSWAPRPRVSWKG